MVSFLRVSCTRSELSVIASGVPVTAMASEAERFSDVSGETQGETAQEEGENEDQESVSQDQPEVGEADIQSEEPEESDAERLFRKK